MPEVMIEEREDHRRRLVRTMLLYTPGAVIATTLFLVAGLSLLTGNVGAIFATVIVGLIAFAVDYEALSAARDLRSEPRVTEGHVLRKWSKGRVAFLGRVHYVLIGRSVFEVGPIAASELTAGDQVRIVHWPHTNGVISIHRTSTGGRPAGTID
ncbi:MAG: hypothetical protein O3B31_08375 [Chloroflexi bacterium]|nr:hypothetical protein [Chloroflexota bacterium]MDA1003344.1 hypothetical protein [Chloroflexota bacterium]